MPTVERRTTAKGVVRFSVRFRADGHQTSLTFDTEPVARRFALDCEERGGQWAYDNFFRENESRGEITLGEFAENHFKLMPWVSPGTMDNYLRDWRARWKPHLGHLRMSQVTREEIIRALAAQTGADKTVANAWGVLTSVLKGAVLSGKMASSPALGVKLPKRTSHQRAEHRYLTIDELHMMMDAPVAEHYKPLLWMLAGTGMRWGEATALTVADINVKAQTVSVTKAWKRNRAEGKFYVGDPKTKKSRRTVTLPIEVVQAVEPLMKGRKPKDLLFTNTEGRRIDHATFHRAHWKRLAAAVPEPAPRIHDLRHSHVAWLLASNKVSLPVIQARLGHEKITTTIDTYGHLLPDLQAAAADAASLALAPRPTMELSPSAD